MNNQSVDDRGPRVNYVVLQYEGVTSTYKVVCESANRKILHVRKGKGKKEKDHLPFVRLN